MKLLAVETSTDACSVTVSRGDRIFEDHKVEARSHTRELVPMIRRQLEAAGLAIHELDAIVLGNGPGSFIGMRLGASVAQGLAFGAGLKIVPVSSLSAIAAEAFATGSPDRVMIAQDARMQEIYCSVFCRNAEGLPEEEGQAQLKRISEFDGSDTLAVAGGAWFRHPALTEGLDPGVSLLPLREPKARYLVGSARRILAAGRAIDPVDLEPGYLRQKVAEIPGLQRRDKPLATQETDKNPRSGP